MYLKLNNKTEYDLNEMEDDNLERSFIIHLGNIYENLIVANLRKGSMIFRLIMKAFSFIL